MVGWVGVVVFWMARSYLNDLFETWERAYRPGRIRVRHDGGDSAGLNGEGCLDAIQM